MDVTLEKLKHSEIKLTIRLKAEAMEVLEAKALKSLSEQVKIEGFRPGKAPAELVKRHVGEEAFRGQVIEMAIDDSYAEAIRKEKIRPVAYPRINILKSDPVEYEATVAVVPELKWKKDPAKIKIKIEKPKVKSEEVDQVLENIQNQFTTWKPSEKAAKMKDRLELDFVGKDPKTEEVLPGTDAQNQMVTLGENRFIPGFEEELVSLKAGDKKSFEITFPKDYHSDEFKGRKVRFEIKVHKVEEAIRPELNDELAQQVTAGNKKTLKELKEEIETEIEGQKGREEEARQDNEFLKELRECAEAEIPEALVDREIHIMMERIEADLKRQNKTLEDYEAEMKAAGKDMHKELEPLAKDQVLTRLALETIQEENPVEVSPEELEKAIEEQVGWYPAHIREAARIRLSPGTQERESILGRLKLRKHVERAL